MRRYLINYVRDSHSQQHPRFPSVVFVMPIVTIQNYAFCKYIQYLGNLGYLLAFLLFVVLCVFELATPQNGFFHAVNFQTVVIETLATVLISLFTLVNTDPENKFEKCGQCLKQNYYATLDRMHCMLKDMSKCIEYVSKQIDINTHI